MAQFRYFADAIYLPGAPEQRLLAQEMLQTILECGVPPTWSRLLLLECFGHATKTERTKGSNDAAVHDWLPSKLAAPRTFSWDTGRETMRSAGFLWRKSMPWQRILDTLSIVCVPTLLA